MIQALQERSRAAAYSVMRARVMKRLEVERQRRKDRANTALLLQPKLMADQVCYD
jgi:hypothetical protein